MHNFNLALVALVTLGAIALFVAVSFYVGRARGKYNVAAPAVTGHPAFERAFRTQMNTLEQLVAFLPVLWLYAWFGNPRWAAWLGGAWLVGRAWYAIGYLREGGNRGPGFLIGLTALALAWVGALGAVIGFLRA